MPFHIIGDEDTIIGFRFAGVTATAVRDVTEARQALRNVVDAGDCRILMLTEQVAHMLEDEVNRHRLAATPPYIVEVPDIWATDVGRPSLEQLIQEAVGIRIVHDTNERESGT